MQQVVVALLLLPLFVLAGAADEQKVSVCVVNQYLEKCKNVMRDTSINLNCVGARDRLECMRKVQSGIADFVNLGANEAYTAATDFKLQPFLEEQTKNGDFMYEGVAVVRQDLTISSLSDLKGKSSCHTGYGRNAGWAIPIALLVAQTTLKDETCGSDLAWASEFFMNSSVPSTWSKDPVLDKSLKTKYSNLCNRCSQQCATNASDKYLGYEGALKCLTETSADIAFTKHVTVIDFANKNPSFSRNYRYLCPNGVKINLNETCFWAARPNPVLVMRELPETNKTQLVNKIRTILKPLLESNLTAYQGILVSYNYSKTFRNVSISIQEYLAKGNYTITMDKLPPEKCKENYVGICVSSEMEKQKCQDLKTASFAQGFRPRIDCEQKSDVIQCLKQMKGSTDVKVLSADAYGSFQGIQKYGMQSILTEQFKEGNISHYVVGVLKNADIKTLKDLKGHKACFPSIQSTSGWLVPAATLLERKIVDADGCTFKEKLAEFWGSSCAPGESKTDSTLCALCKGDGKGNKCGSDDPYAGYSGALKCLAEGGGEIAFVSHLALQIFLDELKTKNEKSANYSLLCPNDDVKPVDQFKACNWAEMPGRMILTNRQRNDDGVTNMKLMLIRAGSSFQNSSTLFRMFSLYNQQEDIMFSTGAVGFQTDDAPTMEKKLYKKFEYLECVGGSSLILLSPLVFYMLVLVNVKSFFSSC